MTTLPPSPPGDVPASGPLTRSLVTLAGTPDDASGIDAQLVIIAQLAAEHLSAVSYASTTAVREGAFATVAATSALAVAVDEAQYADDDGPCLEALRSATPVTIPDMATTMKWPGFARTARRLGLHASLSIPLFAGRGDAVASMNLFSRDTDAMADLAAQVRAAFHADVPPQRDATGSREAAHPDRDVPARSAPAPAGAADLTAGLVEALAVRDRIQLAIGVVVEQRRCSATEAYLSLRVRAAEACVPLPDMAATMLRRVR